MASLLGSRALSSGTFLRHILTLVGATGLSQLLLLAIGPVLTRLYEPAAWGTFSLVVAFVTAASAVTALCYDQAIVGAETEEDAAALAAVTLRLAPVVIIVAVGLLAALIGGGWLGYGGVPWNALWWAAGLLILLQLFVALRYWHMRHERFGIIAKTIVTQNVGRALLPVVMAGLSTGWLGLLSGETLGRCAGILPLLRHRWAETRAAIASQTWSSMRGALRRYSVFARVGLPSSLLDAVALSLPLPLIAAGFGAESAGQFALAQRVLQAPVGLVGKSVADAFHARLSVHARERREYIPQFFRRTALMLLGLAIVPTVVVLALGERGFALIFGAQWEVGGALAVVMLPWAMAQLIVAPLSRAVLVLGGQREKLLYDVTAVLVVLGTFGWGREAVWGLTRTVLVLSLGQAAAYGVYFLVLRRVALRKD